MVLQEGRVVVEHTSLELPEPRRWFEPELVAQECPEGGCLAQRFRGAPAAMQGDDQLVPEALAQRVLGGERFELADARGMFAEGEARLQQILSCVCP